MNSLVFENPDSLDLGFERYRHILSALMFEHNTIRNRCHIYVQDEEVKRELETLELITQARVNAAVASEKAMQLKDTKELQLQVLVY